MIFLVPVIFWSISNISWIEKWARSKKVVIIKNQFFHAYQPRKRIFEIHSQLGCNFITFFPRASKGRQYSRSWKFQLKISLCSVFYMQNWNFGGTSESERTRFVLCFSSGKSINFGISKKGELPWFWKNANELNPVVGWEEENWSCLHHL